MTKYKIEISSTAERQLKKINREDQIRILRSISLLAQNPRPDGCRKFKGYKDVYRIRIGNYRVIYEIDGTKIVVTIIKIGHRRDIYHSLRHKPG